MQTRRSSRSIVPRTAAALVAALAAAASAEPLPAPPSGEDIAIFAGGCFWCMEPPFDELEGVAATISGYVGGDVADPTYEQVSSGGTGHAEAVAVRYDPSVVSYARLLEVFWRNVDPFDANGQFCDRGSQYRSAIFYRSERQRELAAESKQALAQDGRLDGAIATEVAAAGEFYVAEDYHQDYYEKNPLRYAFYRFTCGRDGRLEEIWGATEKRPP